MSSLRRRMLPFVGIAVVATLLAAFAIILVRAHDQSRHALEERFALRGKLAARFSESFVFSLVQSERRRAERRLADPNVNAETFESVARSLDFEAAVLLDDEGRVVHAFPGDSSLQGLALSQRYDHLAAAVDGRVGVSNLVPSAVKRDPVVAFAVPFDSAEGRRVFSGAFNVKRTPLANYLENALPIEGSRLYVVDSNGAIIAAKDTGADLLAERNPELDAASQAAQRGQYDVEGEQWYFATSTVERTPWRVIVAAPEAPLIAPISGPDSWLPWVLFAAFAVAACSALFLLVRTAKQRLLLATANVGLVSTNDELRELDRLKDEFVALVSHELRTPLTSILGYVRVLLRGKAGELPDRQRELLEIVDRNANRLVSLVGDLLFASKVDAGKLELEPSRLSLTELARQSVESALPVARDREIDLSLDAGVELELDADKARLAQLLDNLVSNAVKFTPPGGTVAVRLWVEDGAAVLEVADTGIGIPEEQQAQLFERFFRASTATEREIQGTGLGLSVAKTIAELHGGTISFTSREGEGTTFVVRLPMPSTDESALAA